MRRILLRTVLQDIEKRFLQVVESSLAGALDVQKFDSSPEILTHMKVVK